MKQTQLALLATITLASATLVNVAGVKAADVTKNSGIEAVKDSANPNGPSTASANTTAQFKVEAGKLTLDAAPDFNFGQTVSLAELAAKGELDQATQDGNTVDADADDHGKTIGATTDTLQVSDYRGGNTKWELSAKVGNFKNGSSELAGVITLANDSGDALAGATIDNAAKPVLNSDGTPSVGVAGAMTKTSTFVSGSTVSFVDLTGVKAGTYNAAITWTLTGSDATAGPRN